MGQLTGLAVWVAILATSLQLLPSTLGFEIPIVYAEQPHTRALREDVPEPLFSLWPASLLSRLVQPYTFLNQHFPSLRTVEDSASATQIDKYFTKILSTLSNFYPEYDEQMKTANSNTNSAQQVERVSTAEAAPAAVMTILNLFSPPDPAVVDEWQTAVVNLEDAATTAKAGFFGSLTPTQQDLVNTIIPANLLLSRLGIQGPISQPLISLLRSISPTQLALLRAIFPTDLLNDITQHENDNVAPTLQQAGVQASDKLRSVGIEGAANDVYEVYEDGVEKDIQLASLTATDIYRQLNIKVEGAVRLAFFFDQMMFDLMSPTEVAKKIINSNDLGPGAARKLLNVYIPAQYGMDSKMEELKDAIVFYFDGPQQETASNRGTHAEQKDENNLSIVSEANSQTEAAGKEDSKPGPPLRALGAKRYRKPTKASFRRVSA